MWALIKICIGICICLMVFSALLGSFLLPVALPLVTPQAAHAADMPAIYEESVDPLAEIAAAQASEGAVIDDSDLEAIKAEQAERAGAEKIAVTQELNAPRTAADLSGYGVLNAQNGGFEKDVWRGVSRARAEKLLSRVRQERLKSHAGMLLLQRLLLTEAEAPEGGAAANWLAVRAQTLQSVGAADAAHSLLKSLDEGELSTPDLAQVWVNGRLLIGEVDRACTYVQEYILNTDASYWREALNVCQLLQGNVEGLKLSIKLATFAERASDPLLYNLLEAAASGGQSPRLSPNDALSALHVAVYQGFPNLINPAVIVRLPDVSLRRIMATDDLNISLRLQAAEKLVNDFFDPADAAALIALYEGVDFSDEVLASPLKYVKQEADGSKARALLWQAAGAAKLSSGKALVMKVLWESAEKDMLADLPGSLTPPMRGIEPEANLAWFSPYVIKSALRSGNLPVAKAWWKVLSGNRSLSRDLNVERTDLAVAFAMLNSELPRQVLDQWWATQTLNTLDNRLKTTRILSLLESLDLSVPTDVWVSIHNEFNDAHINRGNGPGPIWLRILGTSLEKNNVGEAILMLLEPTMYTHPATMAPQGVANIVAGLKYLGLNDDATGLALEATLQSELAPNTR